jgi:hypothetical protein
VSTAGQPGTTVRTDGSYGPEQMAGGGFAPGGEQFVAPRRVKLSVSRLDPWSVMKLSFLLSVAVGIAGVVMIVALWTILSGMGVFADMNRTVETVLNSTNGTKYNLMDYIGLGRVVSLSIVIAVIDVILVTALSTLGAFLYNVCSSLVGGLQVTLTDD